MKRFIFSLMVVLLSSALLGGRIWAQNTWGGIKSGLQNGNADNLSQYFDNSLEINILDDEDTFSKSEAKNKVARFFETHSAKSFVIKHEGVAPNGAKYVIGTLSTGQGNFRTYMVIRNGLIQELSIEE